MRADTWPVLDAAAATVRGPKLPGTLPLRIVHEEPDLTAVPERLTEQVTRCLAKDPGARPSITEVVGLCQSANAETVPRRPEDWLPGAVAADITVRTAAPAPVQTPPPPASLPSAAYSPTPPVAPATPPPGYGPPARQPAPQQYPTPVRAQAHAHAYAPTQVPEHEQVYAGPSMHPAARPPKRAGKRGAVIDLAAALVFGIGGGGAA
ncbi:hypothetical protein ACFCX0_08265 [Streptomyces sp. NPDC056352]|uniref:hypothetical protein n=1 Tax=Streptomyces sp. NPDC056352 TaxID=3345791 RepID=UPI0035D56D5A